MTIGVLGVPAGPSELTPDWMAAALGVGDGAITAATAEPLGDGFTGDVVRVRLAAPSSASLPDGAPMPSSVVVKLPTADPGRRAAGRTLRLNEREVYFYERVAPRLRTGLPRCFAALSFPEADGVVVLEDLPAKATVLTTPCPLDCARRVLTTAAELHASTWNRRERDLLRDLPGGDTPQSTMRAEVLTTMLPAFKAAWGDRLDDGTDRVLRYLAERLDDVQQELFDRGPTALVHADLRLGNLLFGSDGTVFVVDWQTVGHTIAAADVAYFLASSLDVEVRRLRYRELLEHYLTELAAHGVEGYGYDALVTDVRDATLLAVAVAVATKATMHGIVDAATNEGLDRWVTRSFSAMIDLGADAVVDR